MTVSVQVVVTVPPVRVNCVKMMVPLEARVPLLVNQQPIEGKVGGL